MNAVGLSPRAVSGQTCRPFTNGETPTKDQSTRAGASLLKGLEARLLLSQSNRFRGEDILVVKEKSCATM